MKFAEALLKKREVILTKSNGINDSVNNDGEDNDDDLDRKASGTRGRKK